MTTAIDLNHIPVLKRDYYLGGRYSRSEGKKSAPAELRGPDLQWWMQGWRDRDNELCPERAVTKEEAALIRKEQERSERRAAREKTQVRRKIGHYEDMKALRHLNREVWEE